MVFWSIFLLYIFIPTVSHFVLCCTSTHNTYDVVVQLSLTSCTEEDICERDIITSVGLHNCEEEDLSGYDDDDHALSIPTMVTLATLGVKQNDDHVLSVLAMITLATLGAKREYDYY
ncbi:hypothetical protein B296_00011938 [Ensete ventricosum]|uniref:Secreted protein n=1 Tax=Ensete ventricosum TaxID=4639 RepID=A0A427B230_ENSVE|nr:hypothetical protein B296_00011938 [Ensete ventricosum]